MGAGTPGSNGALMTETTPIHLVFMLEELSAKYFLEKLLPQIIPSRVTFQCIPHRWKSDLQRSIPIKLKNWLDPNNYFIILHDQDSHDCVALKNQLQQLCAQARQHTPLIRIVCQELEAWYFGDLNAVENAFPRFNADQYENMAQYRQPDSIVKPSKELEKIVKGFRKGHAARTIPEYMNIDDNKSPSFRCFVVGVKNLVETAQGN